MAEEKLVNHDGAANDSARTIAENDPSYQAGFGRGLLNDHILEPLPKRINTTGEKVINNGNAWIVLGRDRPGSRAKGYGGSGATQASAIDLCVGMGNPAPGPATAEFVDPNFKGDSARIYISQRCDVDDAFYLRTSKDSKSDIGFVENQSAIGLKADSVRVVGVNGIKLITRPQNKDSRGGMAAFNGVELIAGNVDSELQYMVKGNNLVESMAQLEQRVSELSAVVFSFLKSQILVNTSIASHTHTGVGGGVSGPVQTFPSIGLTSKGVSTISDEIEQWMDTFKGRVNLNIFWHNNYLSPAGDKYILSKYNKVN
tara:strand:+ start:4779 stop:5720 length:942 start_codon:yes stop_codon:yes gene_type:complete